MSKQITGIIGWLKDWFYDETEIDGFVTTLTNSINSKLNSNLTEANKNLVTNGSGTVVLEDKPVIPDVSGKADKSGGVQQVTDSNAHSNIGTSASATQGTINTAIDTAIGNLSSIRAIEVVSTLPTASSSTMGRLYIISENSKVNVYYTEQSGTTYSWHKMDADILDELSIDWSEIDNNPFSSSTPSSFANATHTHVASAVSDLYAHSNIGSGANATQSTINTKIDTAIGNKASSDHRHGELTNGGQIYTTETITANDGIVITDYSDDNKLKRTTQLLAYHIKDGSAHNNIGTTANATQLAINSGIDTALGNKLSATKVTTWSSTTSNNNVPSEKLVKDSLDDLEDTIASFDASNIDFEPSSQIWGDYTQVVSTVAEGLDWLKEITNGLNASVIGKQDEITSIVLVDKATDANGKIIFYTGDEPT